MGAIWWVEPTTKGGIAFLFFMVFILVLAVIELAVRLWRRFNPKPEPEDEPPVEAIDAPAAGTTEPPSDVNRSRER